MLQLRFSFLNYFDVKLIANLTVNSTSANIFIPRKLKYFSQLSVQGNGTVEFL